MANWLPALNAAPSIPALATSTLREKTCGDLQALLGRKAFPLKSHSELLILLQNLANEEVLGSIRSITKEVNESNLPVSEQPTEYLFASF